MSVAAETLLEAEELERTFGRRHAVRALAGDDVTVSRGRSVGIAGESGSGKSTLLKLLLALDRPSAGSILFQGKDLATISAAETREYRGKVQTVFQDPSG